MSTIRKHDWEAITARTREVAEWLAQSLNDTHRVVHPGAPDPWRVEPVAYHAWALVAADCRICARIDFAAQRARLVLTASDAPGHRFGESITLGADRDLDGIVREVTRRLLTKARTFHALCAAQEAERLRLQAERTAALRALQAQAPEAAMWCPWLAPGDEAATLPDGMKPVLRPGPMAEIGYTEFALSPLMRWTWAPGGGSTGTYVGQQVSELTVRFISVALAAEIVTTIYRHYARAREATLARIVAAAAAQEEGEDAQVH